MKLHKLAIATIVITSFFVACATTQTMKEEDMSLRHTSLLSEDKVVPVETNYNTATAGTSTKIERSFENAPPMISHDIEGMLPITADNNMCLTCHSPEVAKSMGVISVPKSHLTNFREDVMIDKAGNLERDGKIVGNSSDIKLVSKPLDHVSNARFVCVACHAPQSDNKDVPANNFAADFRSKGLNEKSNFIDNFGEGVK